MSSVSVDEQPSGGVLSVVKRAYTYSWTQILITSFIFFCCPGVRSIPSCSLCFRRASLLTRVAQMYNALSGLGGSGQLDSSVAANANVALLSATAGTALFVVGPIFKRVGPTICLLIGGWSYGLYSGSLLSYNRMSCLAGHRQSGLADTLSQIIRIVDLSLPPVPSWAWALRSSGWRKAPS